MLANLRAIPQRLLTRFSPMVRDTEAVIGDDADAKKALQDYTRAGESYRIGAARSTGKTARMTACLLLPVMAAAYMSTAQGATEEEQSKACKADAIKLCSEFIPSKDKITACMQSKVKQLSPGCRKMFKQSK
jgi:hypothetical protein